MPVLLFQGSSIHFLYKNISHTIRNSYITANVMHLISFHRYPARCQIDIHIMNHFDHRDFLFIYNICKIRNTMCIHQIWSVHGQVFRKFFTISIKRNDCDMPPHKPSGYPATLINAKDFHRYPSFLIL